MSYRIDHAAVRQLAWDWGIRGPVTVKRASRATYWGRHHFALWGEHRITITNGQPSPLAAADTLAHELCHAMQAEAHGYVGWLTLCKQADELPHGEQAIEIEAYAWGAAHAAEVLDRCFRVTA